MDPLADQYASISPYAYVANNPLIFIDPDGMRIIIGGQEWNAGDKYNGKPDSFEAMMFDALNNIASESDNGATWLNELAGSDFVFNIEQTNEQSRFQSDNVETIEDGPNGRYATIPEAGGGTAFINITNPRKAQTERGEQIDIESTVAHELIGHGIDAKRGKTDVNPLLGTSVAKAEFSATERENVIRADRGKPLRTHYASHPTINKSKEGVKSIPSNRLLRSSRNYKKN